MIDETINGMSRQLSFRALFLHKLNVIISAYGTKLRAAKEIGVRRTNFYIWLDKGSGASSESLEAIDRVYQVAWEKLLLRRKQLDKKIVRETRYRQKQSAEDKRLVEKTGFTHEEIFC